MYRKRKMYWKNGSRRNHRPVHGRAQRRRIHRADQEGSCLHRRMRRLSVLSLRDGDDGRSSVSVSWHFEFGNRDWLCGNDGFDRRLGSRRRLRRKELGTVEQGAPKRSVVAGPGTLEVSFALEVGAHTLHLGIEVVKVVKHERFREHGQLGRAELVLAVMADDQ